MVEVAAFHWELQVHPSHSYDGLDLHSSLSGSVARSQWHTRRTSGRVHGDFRFTIYLGAAWLQLFRQGQPVGRRVFFEVITEKIGYAQEYRTMVEAIGSRCSQLLLDWGAPTALNLAADPEKQGQTLLEKFLFLRHVLGPDRLDLYLETLARRPHSTLLREQVWQPAAFASPAAFARDPLRYGRHWEEAPAGDEGMIAGFNAQEILSERKFDSFDTPPNRFIKFALQSFRGICEDVIHSKITNPDTGRTMVLNQERGAAWQEAVQMRDTLDACLAAPFFADISPLRRIPFESQALQKREGYREILHAWLMLDVAAQIDWPGRNDAYDGTNRDVATLYEFWLYFVLLDVFQKQLAMTWLRDEPESGDGPLPFCCKSHRRRHAHQSQARKRIVLSLSLGARWPEPSRSFLLQSALPRTARHLGRWFLQQKLSPRLHRSRVACGIRNAPLAQKPRSSPKRPEPFPISTSMPNTASTS